MTPAFSPFACFLLQVKMEQLEDQILRLLEASGNFLDDVELVNTLQHAKATSERVCTYSLSWHCCLSCLSWSLAYLW